jgi:hypothetical protein
MSLQQHQVMHLHQKASHQQQLQVHHIQLPAHEHHVQQPSDHLVRRPDCGSLPLTGQDVLGAYPQNWQQSVQPQQSHPKQLPNVHVLGVSTQSSSSSLPLNVQGLNQYQSVPASEGSSLPLTDQDTYFIDMYSQNSQQHRQQPPAQEHPPSQQNPQKLSQLPQQSIQEVPPEPSDVEKAAGDYYISNEEAADLNMSSRQGVEELKNHPIDSGAQQEESDNSWHDTDVQVVNDNVEECQSIGEQALVEKQLKSKADVTNDGRCDSIPMGTDKCEETKSQRKSLHSHPLPHAMYEPPLSRTVSNNSARWIVSFLEYDKSVVIKLLSGCK